MLDQFVQRVRHVTREGVTYWSLVDICEHFADTSQDARNYWQDTKRRLRQDGFETLDRIQQFKLTAKDGKQRLTDVADAETCLRIVQSIPSPKAEPIREWLARVAYERIEETADPEKGIERAKDRAVQVYQKRGKDSQWIATRLQGIDNRKFFTDALKACVIDIQGKHYAQATNTLYEGLWHRTAAQLRNQLNLRKSDNLRDHQPSIAFHYQGIVEEVCALKLGEHQTVDWATAVQIIEAVASLVGGQAEQLGSALGIDIATGKPTLKDHN